MSVCLFVALVLMPNETLPPKYFDAKLRSDRFSHQNQDNRTINSMTT